MNWSKVAVLGRPCRTSSRTPMTRSSVRGRSCAVKGVPTVSNASRSKSRCCPGRPAKGSSSRSGTIWSAAKADEGGLDPNHLSMLSLEFAANEPPEKPQILPVTVPSVLGYTEIMARRKLSEAGFQVTRDFQAVIQQANEPIQADRVVDQLPRAGEKWPPGGAITIFIGRETADWLVDDAQTTPRTARPPRTTPHRPTPIRRGQTMADPLSAVDISETMAAPLGDLIAGVGRGLAEAQQSLDQATIDTIKALYSGTDSRARTDASVGLATHLVPHPRTVGRSHDLAVRQRNGDQQRPRAGQRPALCVADGCELHQSLRLRPAGGQRDQVQDRAGAADGGAGRAQARPRPARR